VIAWWGWVLIWFGLVLLLLGTLAFFVWRLVKRFFVLVDDASHLLSKLELLDSAVAAEDSRPLNAILADSAEVRRRFSARMDRRADRKHARRQARISRAKMITTADIDLKEWPS
jgi:hypothetical protein